LRLEIDSEYCILREETVRGKKRKLQRVCCRLYPFICWIIIKEGPGNFSGGRSPHWVNHVNLCLYCIVYLLCLFPYLFYLFIRGPVFLTTGIRAKGNSWEKRVPSSSGSNVGRWKV
jgi:hypothetical protein